MKKMTTNHGTYDLDVWPNGTWKIKWFVGGDIPLSNNRSRRTHKKLMKRSNCAFQLGDTVVICGFTDDPKQWEQCDATDCDRIDFCGPGGGSFWGPWFYCAEHDKKLSDEYQRYCETHKSTIDPETI